jgi:quercetin dioxygenase-like cupin family protein
MKTLLALALLTPLFIGGRALTDEPAAPRHAEERDGAPTVIHRADVLRDRGTDGRHLWPLYSDADVRLNYFEVAGLSAMHFHPDADHRVYVLEGKLLVTVGTNAIAATAGDFIVIPKGVRHNYDVAAKGERALLLTFDAPPYDPRKTVNLEPSPTNR